jgi:TolB-like protein
MRKSGRRASYPAIALLALCIAATAAFAEEKETSRARIAVVNFAENKAAAGTGRAVKNSVEMNFFRDGSFVILEQSQMDSIVQERKLQFAECRDEKCAARLGQLLKADYVVIGSVDRLDTYTITLKVVNVREGNIIISESREAREIGEIRPASEDLARKVMDGIKKIRSGRKAFGYPVYITSNFQYTFPVGYLKRLAKAGYGASVSARIEDIFVKNLLAGVEVQCIYLKGGKNMRHAVMIPLFAQVGYALDVWRLSFVPMLSVGAGYSINYYCADILRLSKSQRKGFQFMLKAGIGIDMTVYKNFHVRIGAEFGSSFEKGGDAPFISCIAGAGVKF